MAFNIKRKPFTCTITFQEWIQWGQLLMNDWGFSHELMSALRFHSYDITGINNEALIRHQLPKIIAFSPWRFAGLRSGLWLANPIGRRHGSQSHPLILPVTYSKKVTSHQANAICRGAGFWTVDSILRGDTYNGKNFSETRDVLSSLQAVLISPPLVRR